MTLTLGSIELRIKVVLIMHAALWNIYACKWWASDGVSNRIFNTQHDLTENLKQEICVRSTNATEMITNRNGFWTVENVAYWILLILFGHCLICNKFYYIINSTQNYTLEITSQFVCIALSTKSFQQARQHIAFMWIPFSLFVRLPFKLIQLKSLSFISNKFASNTFESVC